MKNKIIKYIGKPLIGLGAAAMTLGGCTQPQYLTKNIDGKVITVSPSDDTSKGVMMSGIEGNVSVNVYVKDAKPKRYVSIESDLFIPSKIISYSNEKDTIINVRVEDRFVKNTGKRHLTEWYFEFTKDRLRNGKYENTIATKFKEINSNLNNRTIVSNGSYKR